MKLWQNTAGLALAVWLAVAVCGIARAETPDRATIFAAASLQGALDTAIAAYGDAKIVVSYGGSGTIARQIASGAPADIVILASTEWMDWLADQSLLLPGTRADLLSNSLVLVTPRDAAPVDPSAQGLLERLGPEGRIAVGQVASVPAGIYARVWMLNAGLWPALQSRLAETENVRAALALVSRGETPLGVVYGSDAQADPGVRPAYVIPAGLHPPIRYPAALVRGASAPAADFLTWLYTAPASAIFANHGFVPLGAAE